MKLSENIKSLREKQGMSLEDVGKKISASRATVMRYENGMVKNITCDKIILLANAFGCTPQHLVGWDDSFTDANAELMNEILSDSVLTAHLKKLTGLCPEHKQTLYDMIAYWWDKENIEKNR